MPQIVLDVFPGDGVLDVLFGVDCEDIGNERRFRLGRLVFLFDVFPKCSFSSSNFRSAEPCAMIGSTINDGKGFSVSVPPEPWAR